MREKPTEDIRLVLKSTDKGIDPWRYNLPSGTDVAVIIPTQNQNISRRDVVVYKNAAHHPTGLYLMRIQVSH